MSEDNEPDQKYVYTKESTWGLVYAAFAGGTIVGAILFAVTLSALTNLAEYKERNRERPTQTISRDR